MTNRVYVLTVPGERIPPARETTPTDRLGLRDLPARAVQRGPEIRRFVDEETARVTGRFPTPGHRYLRREPDGEFVLVISIPRSESDACIQMEAAGCRFLHEEPSIPFSADGLLTIPQTFQALALGNTVDADLVRRNAGIRGRLASALDRTAEAVPKESLEPVRWMSVDQDPENGTILVTWTPNPPGQPQGWSGGRDHPPLTVGRMMELLAHLPPEMPVEAEGCDCVNYVKGVGLYRLEPDDKDGPRCILVAEPDFYGVLGPSVEERNRRAYLAEQQRRRQTAQSEGEDIKTGV